MAVTILKLDGTTVTVPPFSGTCSQAILENGVHTGPEKIRVTCEGEFVDDLPFASFDGKTMTLRTNFSDFSTFSTKEPDSTVRFGRARSMPIERGLNLVTKQQEFKDAFELNHEDFSDRVKRYFLKNEGIIQRYFPSKFDLLIRDERLRWAKTEIDFTQQLMSLGIRFRLNAIEEKYQTWLRVIKVNYRQQFYAYVAQKVHLLQQTIYEYERLFFDLMRKRYRLIEENNDLPSMSNLYRQKIEREQERYFGWLEYILDDFCNIVQEKIRAYED